VSGTPAPLPIARGASAQQQEQRIEELVRELTLDEKVPMLSGHGFFVQIVKDGGRYGASLYAIGAGNAAHGIPPLLFMDGPRGIAMGSSTCFPVSMARGASFDVDLEQRIGDAIGRELRAHGGNLYGGVCINLLRHPAWGRAQETYGEDPFLLGAMGAALVRGVKRHNVVATAKHFACNSIENARFQVDVRVDERALREVYLPHFKKCIDAGAGAVMSAYNQVNGAWCGHNDELLNRILKREWGFDGFVYSDFILGCRGAGAAAAGLDVEAPDTIHFGDELLGAVQRGEVSLERIDDALRRVLRSLFRTLAAPEPERYGPEAIACPAHVALAREAAEKSIVLLRNEELLPFDAGTLRRLLVLGRLAEEPNLGDHGSSRVHPPASVTPLAGLRAALPAGCEIVHERGDDLECVAALAARADAVLIVAGYTHEDEGEYIPAELGAAAGTALGGDRVDLGLGGEQEALILAAAAANPKTVVAVVSGSAVVMERWRERVAAILMLWYPGMQGGAALAEVLLGRVNPSGRLPFTIPKSADDLPCFDRDATSIRYDLWHGYTRCERSGIAPAFPFGFGLGYSAFESSEPTLRLDATARRLSVEVRVRNAGERPGDTILQVYAGLDADDASMPLKRLCGFRRVPLQGGASEAVRIDVALRELASFDVASRRWRVRAARWRIWAGSSSDAAHLRSARIALPACDWSVSDEPL
jgi:beta-glucosidase